MVENGVPTFQACITRSSKEHVVVAVRGELDSATASEFEAVLDAALSTSCHITLDVRDLTFIGSSGVGLLVAAHHRVGRIEEAIVLYRPQPMVLRVLEITGADACFDIRTDGLVGDDWDDQSSDTGREVANV
jgi:anti-anti-sigma factor